MDSVELLNVLGNENRRRILQLLSFRPFYFNEISKRLDVGPKAVIDHLDRLERAGLVECYSDKGRRKYFRIARNLVLEVAVSPHSYGVRTHKPEMGEPPVREKGIDIRLVQEELSLLEKRRLDLRQEMNLIESQMMEVRQLAWLEIHSADHDQLDSEILAALLSGEAEIEALSRKMEVPTIILEDHLRRLHDRGLVRETGGAWSLDHMR